MKKLALIFACLLAPAIQAQDMPPFIPNLTLQSTSAYASISAVNAYSAMLDDEDEDEADDSDKKEEKSEKPVNLNVDVSQGDIDEMAEKLAANFPKKNRNDAVLMYKSLYDAYANEDENPRTINGAMAVYAVGSYVAFKNKAGDLDKLGKDLDVVAEQFERGIHKDPSHIRKVPADEMKSAYLQMIMLGMQMITSVVANETSGSSDSQMVARQKEAGRRNLEEMFKKPAEKVVFSDKGLTFKK